MIEKNQVKDRWFLKSNKYTKNLEIDKINDNSNTILNSFDKSFNEYKSFERNQKEKVIDYLFFNPDENDNIKISSKKKEEEDENILIENTFIENDFKIYDNEFYINILQYMYESNYNKLFSVFIINFINSFENKEKSKKFLIDNLIDDNSNRDLFNKILEVNKKLLESRLILKKENISIDSLKVFLLTFVYYFKEIEIFFI